MNKIYYVLKYISIKYCEVFFGINQIIATCCSQFNSLQFNTSGGQICIYYCQEPSCYWVELFSVLSPLAIKKNKQRNLQTTTFDILLTTEFLALSLFDTPCTLLIVEEINQESVWDVGTLTLYSARSTVM